MGRMGPPGPPGKAVPCGDCPYGTWVPGHYEPVLPEGVEAKEATPASDEHGDAVVAAEAAAAPSQEPQVGAEPEVPVEVEVSPPAVPPQQEIAPEPEAQVASPAMPPPEPEIAETVEEPQEKTKKVRLLSFLRLNPEPLKPSQTLHPRTRRVYQSVICDARPYDAACTHETVIETSL